MGHDEKVAHHEAAHAVIAILCGAGLSDHGINLHAPSSVAGAFGHAGTMTFDDDPTLIKEEQQLDLIRNLMVICAGAASDAKISGISPAAALWLQPGDKAMADKRLLSSPAINQVSPDAPDERKLGLDMALRRVEGRLNETRIWAIVQVVAKAAMEGGGVLSKAEIEALVGK